MHTKIHPFVVAGVALGCAAGIATVIGVRFGPTAVVTTSHDVRTVDMVPCDPMLNMTRFDMNGSSTVRVGTPAAGTWTQTVAWSDGSSTSATSVTSADAREITFQHTTPFMVDARPVTHSELEVTGPGGASAGGWTDLVRRGTARSCVAASQVDAALHDMDVRGAPSIDGPSTANVAGLVACATDGAVTSHRLDSGLVCSSPIEDEADNEYSRLLGREYWAIGGKAAADRYTMFELAPRPWHRPALVPWRLAMISLLVIASVAIVRHLRRKRRDPLAGGRPDRTRRGQIVGDSSAAAGSATQRRTGLRRLDGPAVGLQLGA